MSEEKMAYAHASMSPGRIPSVARPEPEAIASAKRIEELRGQMSKLREQKLSYATKLNEISPATDDYHQLLVDLSHVSIEYITVSRDLFNECYR